MKPVKTRRGRTFIVLGDPQVITMDRLPAIEARFDSDPRIASVSIVAHSDANHAYFRATAPSGCAVAVATDVEALTGALPVDATAEDLGTWARSASERGLWHDWWLSSAPDVAKSAIFLDMSEHDAMEMQDLCSSGHHRLNQGTLNPRAITITIDGTWLGPHQTGAQVLTTAAIEALCRQGDVASIRLVGVDELPQYAAHLVDLPQVHLADSGDEAISDVIWYPNQIDQRVDIAQARTLGRRVITTYLDLIAYDIPRYHASPEAWAAYRALQRRIALSVDGITTISADVAVHLQDEVPRLDPQRVQPIPLGLDHISTASPEPGEDIQQLTDRASSRPFVLVLGNDFHHKNRDFAIEVWEEVLNRGTSCDLVLAGLHVKSSSSRDREEELLTQHTNLRGQAHVLGHVSSQSREWLLAHAAAVLYPSSAEGFGFVPYEAAALGTPSTFVHFGPLAELSAVRDVPQTWSIDAVASDLRQLLEDPEFARTRVDSLRNVITHYTWDLFATQLLDFIRRIDAMPPVEGALVGGSAADASALAAVLSSKSWRVLERTRKILRR